MKGKFYAFKQTRCTWLVTFAVKYRDIAVHEQNKYLNSVTNLTQYLHIWTCRATLETGKLMYILPSINIWTCTLQAVQTLKLDIYHF